MGERPEFIFAAGAIGVEPINDNALRVTDDYQLPVLRKLQVETSVRLHDVSPGFHHTAPS
jgi:hypothetical protein